MNKNMHMGKSFQLINKQESPNGRGTTYQNISLVLPAFNEEASIGSIVLLKKHYSDNVIVVDDGISDRTVSIARRAGAQIIVHEVNYRYRDIFGTYRDFATFDV